MDNECSNCGDAMQYIICEDEDYVTMKISKCE